MCRRAPNITSANERIGIDARLAWRFVRPGRFHHVRGAVDQGSQLHALRMPGDDPGVGLGFLFRCATRLVGISTGPINFTQWFILLPVVHARFTRFASSNCGGIATHGAVGYAIVTASIIALPISLFFPSLAFLIATFGFYRRVVLGEHGRVVVVARCTSRTFLYAGIHGSVHSWLDHSSGQFRVDSQHRRQRRLDDADGQQLRSHAAGVCIGRSRQTGGGRSRAFSPRHARSHCESFDRRIDGARQSAGLQRDGRRNHAARKHRSRRKAPGRSR